jgi:hypothetical protein
MLRTSRTVTAPPEVVLRAITGEAGAVREPDRYMLYLTQRLDVALSGAAAESVAALEI